MDGIEGGSSSSSCGTARQSLIRFSRTKTRRHNIVRFLIFKPWLIRQTYTERRRLAPDYMGSNTHTHQRTQLTIVTNNIIEREFVATAILSLTVLSYHRAIIEPVLSTRYNHFNHFIPIIIIVGVGKRGAY